ncbi:MAG: molecular chaperone HtpG [Candidatus Kapabacteria bacterium]|nr:molecular chaperone HtpG [Candidatus Kapabacteria bacterium]
MEKVQSHSFKAEMKQLLNLIIHSLYAHPEVFLRELVSNSSDALSKIRIKKLTDSTLFDFDSKLEIKIKLDKETNIFSIEDTGIGMDENDLINNIGTIAKSGTLEFISKLKESKKEDSSSLIGQFGVGFYSAFMVTDEVTIETRNDEPNGKAYRWKSNGDESFTIEEIEKENRGTKISFALKEEFKEYLEDWKIKTILKKYSNFVEFDLSVNDEKVNSVTAIWQRSKDDIKEEELNEFYKFVTNDYNEPLTHLHLNIEGNINFKSLLFIPASAPMNLYSNELDKGLQLYTKKIFIQDDSKNLLPDYLKFVRGVVDTEDLPLNVSREVTQTSPILAKIKTILTTRILNNLEEMSNKDKDKYKKFYLAFGPIFKTGANSDYTNKEKITKLLRFESTHSEDGEMISLTDYVSRMKEDQTEIFYLSASNKEIALKNPNLEFFKSKDIEVLILSDPMDVFVVPNLYEFDGKSIKSIDKADVKVTEAEEKSEEAKTNEDNFIAKFKDILGDKVENVIESLRLVDSPVTLVVGQQGMDAQMEKMMQMMDKDFVTSKKIMEINLKHPLIKNLEKLFVAKENEKLELAVNQLYEGAMLIEGYMKNPNEFVNRMYGFMQDATN